MRLYVGLTTLTGSIERYADRFDLLELRADPGRLPSAKALRRMRASAPKLLLSVLLPPRVTGAALSAPDSLAPLLPACETAEWLVLQTGPEIGPSRRSRGQLAALVAKLKSETRRIAWEPHGLWDEETAHADALELGVTLVQDLSVTPGVGDSIIYTRLRVPGPGSALRSSALETLAEELEGAEQACVVIEGRPSQRARSRIRHALQGVPAIDAEGVEEGDDLAEDDELDEDGELDEDDFEDGDEAGGDSEDDEADR